MICIDCPNLKDCAYFMMCGITQKKIKRENALKENNCWKCLDCNHINHNSMLNCEKCGSFNGKLEG